MRAVYDASREELSKGWLTGPFNLCELPPGACLTRRFEVKIRWARMVGPVKRVRPIDDFTESLINMTNSCEECICVRSVDFIVAALVYRMNLARESGLAEHLQMRAIDLRKAYKQLPLSAEALGDSFLCIQNPDSGEPEAYQSTVLPFGARAAAHGSSSALWSVGALLLKFHWSCFFDDLLVVSREAETMHCDLILDSYFSLLGWETSTEKSWGFETCAKALGVLIDLGECHLCSLALENTPQRKQALMSSITDLLARPDVVSWPPHEAGCCSQKDRSLAEQPGFTCALCPGLPKILCLQRSHLSCAVP